MEDNECDRGDDLSTKPREKPSFDDVLEQLGPVGRFQTSQIVFLSFMVFFNVMVNLSFVFLGYTPPHQCNKVNEPALINKYSEGNKTNETLHISYQACTISVYQNNTGVVENIKTLDCPSGRSFIQDSTYISDWDLVCESKGLAELAYTVFNVARIPGAILGSVLTDRFGRKKIIILASFVACLFELACILSPNVIVLIVMKFVSGFCYQGYSVACFTLISELVISRHRQTLSGLYGVAWVFYVIVYGGIAYLLQNYNWKYLNSVAAVSMMCILISPFILKESPRWLGANNRKNEVLDLLRAASKQNKKDFAKVKKVYIDYSNATLAINEKCDENIPLEYSNGDCENSDKFVENAKPSLLSVFRHKKIIILVLMNVHIWVAHTLTYYGLYLTSSALAGDRFLNYTLMAIVEIPSYVCLPLAERKMGRKPALLLFLCLTTISLLISTVLISVDNAHSNAMQISSTVLFIFGKFSVSASFSLIYVVTAELFPTNIRTTVLGLCSGISRLGSMLAPFLRMLYEKTPWAPGLIFTLMCGVAFVMVFTFPETKHRDLPNTLNELLDNRTKPCEEEKKRSLEKRNVHA